jgi:hemolysin activation/secretion protein
MLSSKKILRTFGIVILIFLSFDLLALPDSARRLRRDIEEQQKLDQTRYSKDTQVIDEIDRAGLDIPEKKSTGGGGKRFRLSGVQFETISYLIDLADLDDLASGYLDKDVDITDLYELLAKINQLYISLGHYTARAVLPPQKISDGPLLIRLVEGRLGELYSEPSDSRVKSFVSDKLTLRSGEVVDLPDLGERLAFHNRSSSVPISLGLEKGQDYGATDAHSRVHLTPNWQGALFIDNASNGSIGTVRRGVQLSRSHLAVLGDRISLSINESGGEFGAFGGYTANLGPKNSQVSFYYGVNKTEVTRGLFKDIGIEGKSSSISLSLNQPLVLIGNLLVGASFSAVSINSKNLIKGNLISSNETDEYTLGLDLNYRGDDTSLSVNFAGKMLDTDKPANTINYMRSLNSSFLYRMSASWSLVFNSAMQITSDRSLPSSHYIDIGGVSTIRGYDQSLYSGTAGYFYNAELHRRIGDNVDLFTFYDRGQVKLPTVEGMLKYRLSSAGVGIAFNVMKTFNFNLVYGRPVQNRVGDDESGQLHARFTVSFSK